ncbi:MAG: sulfite exporter TauE/SafE family protein [Pseudomonadales bacterium]|nr:sulfite exporter TauE/SafE family protein [Pseudomonadales bacterium]
MAPDLVNLVLYIASGAFVGLLIGLTGVGGGSLMTPILILMNIPYHIAIGTDLLYAAITKGGGVFMHSKRGNINWRIVLTLLAGSLPASIITALTLKFLFPNADGYQHILTTALGFMLIFTAGVLLFKQKIQSYASKHQDEESSLLYKRRALFTFASGLALGVCVTLSSVGAGAFGTAILLVLYTRLPTMQIIGTDLAHAVPLTLMAGMGHFLFLGNVDFTLLTGLLIGSIPAVYIGTKLGAHLPERFMYNLLALILLILGARFAFF